MLCFHTVCICYGALTNLLHKILNRKDYNFGPIYVFQDTEMSIIGNNIFGTSSNCTIYELVIIVVFFYQPKMNIDFLKKSAV